MSSATFRRECPRRRQRWGANCFVTALFEESAAAAQPVGLLAVGAVGDVDDVAVVVDAGFDEQVGTDGAAHLDGRASSTGSTGCW